MRSLSKIEKFAGSDSEALRSHDQRWKRLNAILFALTLVVGCVTVAGCSRAAYRQRADRDAYQLIQSRQVDARWLIPSRTVEPDPTSRMSDNNCPDCGPIPPDDPLAHCYMVRPFNTRRPIDFWERRGILPGVDDESWIQYLPTDEKGIINVDQQMAVNLALIHNRNFQTQVEQLHSQAIGLSANRFEFEANWFAGTNGGFAASADGLAANRTLNTNPRVGFSRNLASGGQFLTNIINSFTWQLGGGPNTNFATGGLLFQLTQPLLRGAYRYVRTESLTQAERSLLYSVRNFARFRRQFYFNIVNQYLGLISQKQAIEINRENLRSLELNLEEHNILYDLGKVSPIQVDQVALQYQNGRLAVFNSEQGLEASLDQFKLTLGLPAKIQIEIDDSAFDQFSLNSDELFDLQQKALDLGKEIAEYVPPEEAPQEFLERIYNKIKRYHRELEPMRESVMEELKKWESTLEDEETDGLLPEEKQDRIDQRALLKQNLEALEELQQQSKEFDQFIAIPLEELTVKKVEPAPEPDPEAESEDNGSADEDQEDESKLEPAKPDFVPDPEPRPAAIERWEALQALISQRGGLKARIGNLYVSQAQIRLFSIQIKKLNIEERKAIEFALENRLDLMNNRAQLVDSYRSVELAANRLQSDLSVTASANLQTDPNVDNAFRLDSENNQYNIGVNFDGPVNRFNERNSYRLAQIGYQQQRRTYMQAEDTIVVGIRQNLRQLLTNRYNFLILRQQLINATSQLDQAQFNLRTATSGDSSLTQDVLRALQNLRDAKTSLISSWINYETSRIALFVDLELLQLNEQGVWINENETFENLFGLSQEAGDSSASSLMPETDDSNLEQNNVPDTRETNDGNIRPRLEPPVDTGDNVAPPEIGAAVGTLDRVVRRPGSGRQSGLLSVQR